MKSLAAKFADYLHKSISRDMKDQEALLPVWHTLAETLPANVALRTSLIDKCPELVAVTKANNRLQDWQSLLKKLKKASTFRLPIDFAREVKAACDLGFETVCICWLMDKMVTIAAIENLVVRKNKLDLIRTHLKDKKFHMGASVAQAFQELEETYKVAT